MHEGSGYEPSTLPMPLPRERQPVRDERLVYSRLGSNESRENGCGSAGSVCGWAIPSTSCLLDSNVHGNVG